MATEAATEDHRQQAPDIDLSPSAKMGIIMSLRASGLGSTIHQLTLTGPDYEHLDTNWSFHVSSYYRRYFQSYELRMTLEALLTGSFETLLEAAFDESRKQLLFRSAFPHPEFLQSLVKKFMASENPRSLRRIQLIKIGQLPEAGSASFHFPRAYDTLFPCTYCTAYRTENETDLFVEVFHFANRKDTSVCATVSFRMSVDHVTKHIYTMDSQIEVQVTGPCRPQRARLARPSRMLFTQFDTFFGVLQEVNPDGLEKLHAVSQGWRVNVDRHREALPRRKMLVDITFTGKDPT